MSATSSSAHFLIYENIRQCVTMSGVAKDQGRHPTEKGLGVICDAAVVVNTETNLIDWIGVTADLPEKYRSVTQRYISDDGVWLPELVDCHTHLVFGGSREQDYSLRAQGATYQSIASQGGGILSTIQQTRQASLEQLIESSSLHLMAFKNSGVGAIEIKSGYGLTLESELKMLMAIKQLQQFSDLIVVPTFLPAHATPPEYKGKTDLYVDTIVEEWLPKVAEGQWAEFFDVFIEEGFFNVPQASKLCRKALDLGFKIKLHSDQFNCLGGTELGIELGATSIDHLECVSENSISKLGESETVAVLMPAASLFTGYGYPPARKLIDSGARVALSTDFNPGTSPTRNLPLITTLACSQLKMTVAEALVAVTYNAAVALGLSHRMGSLEVGKEFRVATFRVPSYESIPYRFGEI